MCITVSRHGKCFWDGRPCATISVKKCELKLPLGGHGHTQKCGDLWRLLKINNQERAAAI